MTNLRLRKPRASKRLNRIGLAAVLVLALGFGAVRFLGFGQPMLLVATKTIVAGDRLTGGNTNLRQPMCEVLKWHTSTSWGPLKPMRR